MAVNNGPGPVPGPNVGPGPGPGPGPVPAGGGPAPVATSPAQRLDAIDEQVWLQLGSLAESMGEFDRAMASYESALRHNYHSVSAMNLIAELYRSRENFPKAAEYFQRILAIDNASGEVWGSLGHCYLMMDELQKAYNAYQNALHHLPNPKDSKLWYGIGILYDRYGSVEHAEEAFSAVMRMDPKYEKANEIYFRLGIIYKGQQKYVQSLECFRYILHAPPRPLTEADIWFQIGHVHEQQKEYTSAKEAYERVLTDNPNHAKVLQQLGWLYHQQNASFVNQDLAIKFLTRSIESDNTDAQSWYLMGRCYMAQQKFNKAYEAYQQAVYRDSRNPTFWCSIGLLYFQINQYRDALDAYSKAIRINPNISEVWYDLGTLYESCNNQVSDAIDAYQRASDLDPENPHIKQRLAYLRQNNGAPGGIPPPEEMNPNAYPPSGGANGQNPFGQRITVAPQGPPTGMQGYTGRQQGPPAPLSAAANGEHQQPGRDLPLPGNGNGGNNGHVNAGPATGSPGSYPHEERQPHIPGINTGGPRPPTPAGAMPQMMSNERLHSQPPPPPSGHAQGRGGPRARPPSPGPEGPYGRPGSPGMHAGGAHGHDPHYQGPPHPSYSQGPPPPGLYNMMPEGQPQGYDRHEDARMKQEQQQHGAPVYQHHRHRSSDLSRMAPMEEDPNAPPGFSRQGHPSDPHAHATSPPRDDRRPPMGTPSHPQVPHPSQQQHQSDPRWMPPHHGRHPSDEQARDLARMGGSPSGPDRGGPNSQVRQPSDVNQQHRHMQQRPYPEHDRNEAHGVQDRSPPPSGVSPDRKDPGDRMAHDHNQDQHRRGYEGDVPSEQDRAWSAQDPHSGSKFRTEDQDQDIAASLVSLSGKGPGRPPISSHRVEDDDYDMEEAAPAPPAPQGSHPSLQESEQSPHHNQQQHRAQADDRYPADHQERPSSAHSGQHHQESQGQPPRQPSQPPRFDEREPSPVAKAPDALTPPSVPSPTVTEQDLPSTSMAEDETPAPRGPSAEPGSGVQDQEDRFHGSEDSSSAVNPSPERASSPAAARRASESSDPKQPAAVQAPESSEPAPSVSSVTPVEDEDTEMEEGEVREDDEVMSSGAVAPVHNKDADN